MKKNMGLIDRGLRITLASVVALMYFLGYINGYLAVILGSIALIFAITSMFSFCPIYLPFGISTCTNKNKKV